MASLFRLPLTCLTVLATLAAAYRPVQFVKHTGDNGRADQAFSITQHYNTTTDQADLYVRMEAYRYRSTARGWTALALGPMMTGGLMFITYGNPNSTDPLTLTVRTASGHHPPEVLSSMTDFYSGPVPEVDVQRATFEPYTGSYFSTIMNMAPSHLGVAEFIVRGYTKWTGAEVLNTTTSQMFIWSSNFKQDFEGDFSVERNIDMHQFGLGFGWVRVDLQNAVVPEPMFGAIDDTKGHLGVNEIREPDAPTKEELEAGDSYIASQQSPPPRPQPTPDSPVPTTTAAAAAEAPSATTQPPSTPSGPIATATAAADSSTPPLNPSPIEEPVTTPRQFSIRSLMWHLHGILMILSFLFLYPLGIYLIRCPRPDAFNLHWTVMALGTTSLLLGAVIGYINSHSISITHQYIGLLLTFASIGQGILGWRHHISYLTTKSKTWLSRTHIYLGRVIVPVGFINIITGLRRREYAFFTIFLVVAVMIVEILGLSYYLIMVARRNVRMDQGLGASAAPVGKGVMTGDDAEEYFQLTGDDDEFSDSDGEREGAVGGSGKTKMERKREEIERLRRLDKV